MNINSTSNLVSQNATLDYVIQIFPHQNNFFHQLSLANISSESYSILNDSLKPFFETIQSIYDQASIIDFSQNPDSVPETFAQIQELENAFQKLSVYLTQFCSSLSTENSITEQQKKDLLANLSQLLKELHEAFDFTKANPKTKLSFRIQQIFNSSTLRIDLYETAEDITNRMYIFATSSASIRRAIRSGYPTMIGGFEVNSDQTEEVILPPMPKLPNSLEEINTEQSLISFAEKNTVENLNLSSESTKEAMVEGLQPPKNLEELQAEISTINSKIESIFEEIQQETKILELTIPIEDEKLCQTFTNQLLQAKSPDKTIKNCSTESIPKPSSNTQKPSLQPEIKSKTIFDRFKKTISPIVLALATTFGIGATTNYYNSNSKSSESFKSNISPQSSTFTPISSVSSIPQTPKNFQENVEKPNQSKLKYSIKIDANSSFSNRYLSLLPGGDFRKALIQTATLTEISTNEELTPKQASAKLAQAFLQTASEATLNSKPAEKLFRDYIASLKPQIDSYIKTGTFSSPIGNKAEAERFLNSIEFEKSSADTKTIYKLTTEQSLNPDFHLLKLSLYNIPVGKLFYLAFDRVQNNYEFKTSKVDPILTALENEADNLLKDLSEQEKQQLSKALPILKQHINLARSGSNIYILRILRLKIEKTSNDFNNTSVQQPNSIPINFMPNPVPENSTPTPTNNTTGSLSPSKHIYNQVRNFHAKLNNTASPSSKSNSTQSKSIFSRISTFAKSFFTPSKSQENLAPQIPKKSWLRSIFLG